MTSPYTHQELAEMRNRLEESIERTEREYPEARPLPPMTEQEAHEMLMTLYDTAKDRPLTEAENFLSGQLLAAYRMAIEARMLGRRGRFYVVSEDDINKIQELGG